MNLEGGALRGPLIRGSRELASPNIAAPITALLSIAAERFFQPAFKLTKEKAEVSAG